MARITGIGGVFLKAHDPKALSAWYAQHLGIVLADYGIQPPQTSVTSVGDHGTFELQLRFRHAP